MKRTTIAIGLMVILLSSMQVAAYPRYKGSGGSGNCSYCHGNFYSSTSPKGSTFPSGSKHTMHRSLSHMSTNCDLCHTSGDNRNPYTYSSTGTAANPGRGCSGCHGNDYGGTIGVKAAGLRAHHAKNGITVCAGCHTNDPAPMGEEVPPPYFGTVDTNVDDSCNQPPDYLESWTVGDVEGLDNDGDNEYDECEVMDQDADGIFDDCDIDQNPAQTDSNGNGVIDDCECIWANIDDINPVDLYDFAIVVTDWGMTGPDLAGDANNDGNVDIADLALVAEFWLVDCN